MNKNHISLVYVINIVFQAIFTLAMYIGAALLFGWLATEYWNADSWIYIPLIIAAVLIGFASMIKFVLTAMSSLEALEKQHKEDLRKLKKPKSNEENEKSSNK